jgi:hypothetical protein
MADEKREDFGKVLKEKSMEEFAKRMKGKPTPTQDELNRANLGEHIAEHEADGSDLDENALSAEARHKKQSEAKPSASQARPSTPPRP